MAARLSSSSGLSRARHAMVGPGSREAGMFFIGKCKELGKPCDGRALRLACTTFASIQPKPALPQPASITNVSSCPQDF